MEISYHFEDASLTQDPQQLNPWLERCFEALDLSNPDITYIFCSDPYLLDLNKSALSHDYLTDIITFDNRLNEDQDLFADLFISVDRVKDNAQELGVDFQQELRRVMVHGILHLCGFNDKTESDQKEMRRKEDELINL